MTYKLTTTFPEVQKASVELAQDTVEYYDTLLEARDAIASSMLTHAPDDGAFGGSISIRTWSRFSPSLGGRIHWVIEDMAAEPQIEKDPEHDRLQRHSDMLGRIGCAVSEFCDEDDTTEIGVLKLLAEYRSLQANEAWAKVTEVRNGR